MTDWQPIETAPKDRRILLAFPHEVFTGINVVIGKWDEDRYATRLRPYWTHDRERSVGVRETRNNQPIQWMQIPELTLEYMEIKK